MMVASVLLAAAAGWWWLAADPETGPVSSLRGSEIRLELPASTVADDEGLVFEWSTVLPLDLRYRLELEREGRIVWWAETDQNRYAATEEQRRSMVVGATYRWRVSGLVDGEATLVSEWRTLSIEPDSSR